MINPKLLTVDDLELIIYFRFKVNFIECYNSFITHNIKVISFGDYNSPRGLILWVDNGMKFHIEDIKTFSCLQYEVIMNKKLFKVLK